MNSLELEIENLMLRRTNLELQSRLMAAEHQAITARLQELQNARSNADSVAQPATDVAPTLDAVAANP